MLGDAVDSCLSVLNNIITHRSGNWGQSSAEQSRRTLAAADVNYVDEVLEQREIRRASDRAPHIPNAGTSTVLAFYVNF